jgi:RNA polymerase sigma factor (sigma-70 family)
MAAIGTALDRDVEYGLILRAQDGDIEARNALVTHHYPFIVGWTIKALRPGGDWEEYVSHGVEAFIRGIAGFDTATGNRLVTYCGHGIIKSVRNAHYRDRVIVPPPLSNQRSPHIEEAAEQTGCVASMNRDLGDGFFPLVPTTSQPENPTERAEWLRWSMQWLNRQQHEVIDLRMRGVSLKAIATQRGVSMQRVQQIHASAMSRLREIAA